MIRVLLADDQELFRDGLRTIIDSQDELEVVTEAADGAEALRLAQRHTPDVVVMDVRMPVMDGIEATRRLVAGSKPGIEPPRVLVLTTFDLDEHVYEAMKAGATGFLLKSASRHQLLAAIRDAAAGDTLLAPEPTRRLIDRFVTGPLVSQPPGLDRCTRREREILDHVARGLSNQEIADRMHLAQTTIKTHVSAVLTKLGLRNRVQAVVYAYEYGLVRPGDDATGTGDP